MKKIIIASILGAVGIVGMSVSSYGQGSVFFENYDFGSGLNAPVTFGTTDGGVTAGETVGGTFVANLLYSLNGTTWLTDATSPTGSYPTTFGFGGTDNGNASEYDGYFVGPELTLPQFTGGTCYFIVQAYNGTTYGEAGFWSGESTIFSLTSGPGSALGVGSTPADGDFGSALQPFTVSFVPVPEPATMGLLGLGAASLLALRRRKV